MATNDSKSAKNKREFHKRLKEARIGDPVAQYEVGLMFANGVGVTPDLAQALYWNRLAAEKGDPSAQYLLGCVLSGGQGVTQDLPQGLLWLSRAFEQGHDKASLRLAKLVQTAHDELSFSFFLKAAKLGNPDALFAVGRCFQNGLGAQRDLEQARHWYQLASQKGIAAASFELGQLLELGLGGPIDFEAAVSKYRMASRKGHPGATLALSRLDSRNHNGRLNREKENTDRSGTDRRQPISRWVKYAEKGSPQDCHDLGLMYQLGVGVPASLPDAISWYERAAQKGDVNAQMAMARYCQPNSVAQYAAWLKLAAEQGDPDALFESGYCSLENDSDGTFHQDDLAAFRQIAAAADKGQLQALELLGLEYLAGTRPSLADTYVRRAAEKGSAQAQFQLGQLTERNAAASRDMAQSAAWYRRAAEQGHAHAQIAIATMHAEGKGVSKDIVEAFHWYEKAAQQGVPVAQWQLGKIYASGGVGIPKDARKAAAWCRRAASSGFAPAQATLGNLLALGKKYERAAVWWQKAADGGDAESQFNLANAYSAGKGVAKSLDRFIDLLVCAAESGLSAAQSRLGLAYVTGTGVPADPVEGCKWFLIASAQGDATARANAARAEEVLTKAQFAESERRARRWLGNCPDKG